MMESDGKGNSPGHPTEKEPTMTNITNDQAAALMIAASLRDLLNHRGVALTDDMREQYREQVAEVEDNIPEDLDHAAWSAVATRDPEVSLSNAMFAWIREQNVTD